MCLQSKWIFPRKATKDIVCYKVLTKDDNEHLKTPYQYFPIGTIEELPIIVEGGKGKSIKQYIKCIKDLYRYSKDIVYSIMTGLKRKEEGYIHAFIGLCSAKWFTAISRPLYGKYIIVQCIIPKGTLYHIDEYEHEICAKKMEILEIV